MLLWSWVVTVLCVTVTHNVASESLEDVTVVQDEYGTFGNHVIRRYTFSNANNMTVEIITYGGRISAIRVPDIRGEVQDVVLGFDDLQGLCSYLLDF
jgi:aldose 1-epimerase